MSSNTLGENITPTLDASRMPTDHTSNRLAHSRLGLYNINARPNRGTCTVSQAACTQQCAAFAKQTEAQPDAQTRKTQQCSKDDTDAYNRYH